MAFNIQDTGVNTIFNSSALGAGNWYRIHPKIAEIAFQATITGSSVGVAVGGVINVEASVDGINPLKTVLGTITISSAGGAVSPAADGFTSVEGFQYVRGNLQSLSSGILVLNTSAKLRR
jgi:hypothetical protein